MAVCAMRAIREIVGMKCKLETISKMIDRESLVPLHNQVVQIVAALVVGGEYMPGDRLPGQLRAQKAGIPRHSWEKAQQILQAEGITDKEATAPWRVTEIGPEKAREYLEKVIQKAAETSAALLGLAKVNEKTFMDLVIVNAKQGIEKGAE